MNSRKTPMRSFVILGMLSLVFLAGCSGVTAPAVSSNPPPPGPSAIVVSISPTTASVQVGFSLQFTATVRNDPTNKGVTWGVSGHCAGTDCGTIDSTGKYTAPPTAHFAPGLIITATSAADPTKTATAVVFVTPAPTAVAVSPSFATVQNNGVQQFTATGSPWGTIPVVNWSVSGSGCVAASCGMIDATGKYTAPAAFPNPPMVTVTATSVADSSRSGSATVFLGSNPNNAKLNGQYAFLFSGYDGDGNAAIAGSFTADGNGNIAAGIADFNFSSSIFVATNLTFTGTYSIGPDNRGSMTMTALSGVSQTFSFALGSFTAGVAGRGRLIELDGTDIWGTGVLAKQDPAAFSTAAVNGGYAFGFAGTSSTGFALAADGRFTASGGSLSAGQIDVYGLGVTFNGAGTPTAALDLPFAGTYQVAANGRGTATLAFTGQDPGFSNFSFYVISVGELFFTEVDTCPLGAICTFKGGISGFALRQSGGPFAASSLKGAAVFNLTGGAVGVVTGGTVAVGQESFDGSGSLSGTVDENNGSVITSNRPISGSYSVDNDGLGRGVITLAGDPQPKPFYLVSPGRGFIIDTGSFEAGMFETQSGGPFGSASVSGNYVLGTLPWPLNWSFSPVSGIVTANGAGTLNGTPDGKDGSGSGTGQSFTGSYSVSANGRATLAITVSSGATSNWVLYIISPSKALAIPADTGGVNKGVQIIEQ